ncbi:hypothetical protein BGZ57DRAFT_875711 [Hyaloscypha finlandica]|nr:hypothetical protein BGZ57DRAFT_875711 [Hyaloscypha finlandica]
MSSMTKTKSTKDEMRCLYQVAKLFGWSQSDRTPVFRFYCQQSILRPFVQYWNHRLAKGCNPGRRNATIVKLAMKAFGGEADDYMGEIKGSEYWEDGEMDTWFLIRLVTACRLPGSVWESRGDENLKAMCEDGIGVIRVLNKHFAPPGKVRSDLVKEMVREARNLGLDLDVGIDMDATRAKPIYGSRGSKQGVSDNVCAMDPSVFQTIYTKFANAYNYTETLPLFRFTVIMLYCNLQILGGRADKSPAYLDKFVYLRPVYLKILEEIERREGRHPGSLTTWMDERELSLDQGILKWEWVKAVSNTEEGKAFLGKYEERRARGILH